MTKRLIEIDDELLESAQDALGTAGVSDTVRAALNSAVVAHARAKHWHGAFTIQRELARSGRLRAVGIHDLLASVIAVEHRLVMFHYDSDFETVASVVDLNHRWVAPRGSLEES